MPEVMPEVSLKIDPSACLKIALGLRRIEFLLQGIASGTLAECERTPEHLGIRQEQLLWLAGKFEQAHKENTPEMPPHERPKQPKRKQVWCAGPDCTKALSLEQARASDLCPACRKKPAA